MRSNHKEELMELWFAIFLIVLAFFGGMWVGLPGDKR